ncbi:hypothetical protein BMS3Abin16_01263 [archaeon BMS3Abin16]|nr:hypothetical protein BMS3Abin16_01263 [archaeon BMS3Abin16]
MTNRTCPLSNRKSCIKGDCKWYSINEDKKEDCDVDWVVAGYTHDSNKKSEYDDFLR